MQLIHNRNSGSQIFAEWYIARRQVISDLNEPFTLVCTGRFARASEITNDKIPKPQRGFETQGKSRCCVSLAGRERERKANKVTTIKLTAQISRFTAPLTHSLCTARMCLLPPTIYQQCIQAGYKYAWITRYANSQLRKGVPGRYCLPSVSLYRGFSSPAAFAEKYIVVQLGYPSISRVSFALLQLLLPVGVSDT